MAALMLGIDFSKTDMQISLWNEEKTCADVYQFPDAQGAEVIPTMVIMDENDRLLIGKEALDYSIDRQKQGITSFYGNFTNETIEFEHSEKTVNELFGAYLQEILSAIRKRYGGASIARIGITGERLNEEKREHLRAVMESIGYSGDKLFFTSHADAVLWYEVCEGVDKGASMTLDFDSKGMLAYLMRPGDEEKRTPHYLETIDYSSLMQGGLASILEEEERTNSFANITDLAIARKNISRIYVTGTFIDHPQITQVLSNYISAGRRIFTGRSLYCLGACYHAVKEKFPKKVIGDRQIFHTVSLEAYKDAVSGPVLLLKEGTELSRARAKVQVILDDTKDIMFRIEDARTAEHINCTLHPEEMKYRENKTLRLEIEIRFLDYETLVLKLRDIGFGDIYPATYRVWEQIVNLA